MPYGESKVTVFSDGEPSGESAESIRVRRRSRGRQSGKPWRPGCSHVVFAGGPEIVIQGTLGEAMKALPRPAFLTDPQREEQQQPAGQALSSTRRPPGSHRQPPPLAGRGLSLPSSAHSDCSDLVLSLEFLLRLSGFSSDLFLLASPAALSQL